MNLISVYLCIVRSANGYTNETFESDEISQTVEYSDGHESEGGSCYSVSEEFGCCTSNSCCTVVHLDYTSDESIDSCGVSHFSDELVNLNLEGFDFRDFNIEKIHLEEIDFEEINLENLNLQDVILKDANPEDFNEIDSILEERIKNLKSDDPHRYDDETVLILKNIKKSNSFEHTLKNYYKILRIGLAEFQDKERICEQFVYAAMSDGHFHDKLYVEFFQECLLKRFIDEYDDKPTCSNHYNKLSKKLMETQYGIFNSSIESSLDYLMFKVIAEFRFYLIEDACKKIRRLSKNNRLRQQFLLFSEEMEKYREFCRDNFVIAICNEEIVLFELFHQLKGSKSVIFDLKTINFEVLRSLVKYFEFKDIEFTQNFHLSISFDIKTALDELTSLDFDNFSFNLGFDTLLSIENDEMYKNYMNYTFATVFDHVASNKLSMEMIICEISLSIHNKKQGSVKLPNDNYYCNYLLISYIINEFHLRFAAQNDSETSFPMNQSLIGRFIPIDNFYRCLKKCRVFDPKRSFLTDLICDKTLDVLSVLHNHDFDPNSLILSYDNTYLLVLNDFRSDMDYLSIQFKYLQLKILTHTLYVIASESKPSKSVNFFRNRSQPGFKSGDLQHFTFEKNLSLNSVYLELQFLDFFYFYSFEQSPTQKSEQYTTLSLDLDNEMTTLLIKSGNVVIFGPSDVHLNAISFRNCQFLTPDKSQKTIKISNHPTTIKCCLLKMTQCIFDCEAFIDRTFAEVFLTNIIGFGKLIFHDNHFKIDLKQTMRTYVEFSFQNINFKWNDKFKTNLKCDKTDPFFTWYWDSERVRIQNFKILRNSLVKCPDACFTLCFFECSLIEYQDLYKQRTTQKFNQNRNFMKLHREVDRKEQIKSSDGYTVLDLAKIQRLYISHSVGLVNVINFSGKYNLHLLIHKKSKIQIENGWISVQDVFFYDEEFRAFDVSSFSGWMNDFVSANF